MSSVDRQTNPRRIFLKKVASASGAMGVGSIAILPAGTALVTNAAEAAEKPLTQLPAISSGYASLSPDEGVFVEAMVNIMCPSDGLTPNGVDCGLATFIDRQLAGGFGRGDRLYRMGPWKSGKPQLGYQLPLTPEQFFKAGISSVQKACSRKFSKRFEQLAPAEAEAFLQDVAAGKFPDDRLPIVQWFNELVYPLFTQACFSDPLYGGNRGKVFWKLVGYPGLPAFHTQNMKEFRGKPFPGAVNPSSIQDFS